MARLGAHMPPRQRALARYQLSAERNLVRGPVHVQQPARSAQQSPVRQFRAVQCLEFQTETAAQTQLAVRPRTPTISAQIHWPRAAAAKRLRMTRDFPKAQLAPCPGLRKSRLEEPLVRLPSARRATQHRKPACSIFPQALRWVGCRLSRQPSSGPRSRGWGQILSAAPPSCRFFVAEKSSFGSARESPRSYPRTATQLLSLIQKSTRLPRAPR